MILGDILALAMVGTWLLALDEYKAKLLAQGRTTFTLLAITGVATIIISYVFYSTAQIASKDYGQVVGWYETVRIAEISGPSEKKEQEIRKFYTIMAQNPKELSHREFYKLKTQYKNVIYTK